jgi:hypothetical protein
MSFNIAIDDNRSNLSVACDSTITVGKKLQGMIAFTGLAVGKFTTEIARKLQGSIADCLMAP